MIKFSNKNNYNCNNNQNNNDNTKDALHCRSNRSVIFNGRRFMIWKCAGTIRCTNPKCKSFKEHGQYQKQKRYKSSRNGKCKQCNQLYLYQECNHMIMQLTNTNLLNHPSWKVLVIKLNEHHNNCLNLPIKSPIPSVQAFVCNLYFFIISIIIIIFIYS